MSYFMSNGAPVNQAAAGLGQVGNGLVTAYADGLFAHGKQISRFGDLVTSFEDGIFGQPLWGMGQADTLDLGDPDTMGEIKHMLRTLYPEEIPGTGPGSADDPAWDANTESVFASWAASKPASTPVQLTQQVNGHVVPAAGGVAALYLEAKAGMGANAESYASTYWPNTTAWITGGGTAVKPPTKFNGKKGGMLGMSMGTATAVGIGVVVVVGGMLLLSRRRRRGR